MNRAVQFMKSRPGRYAVSDSGFDLHRIYFMVEVDDAGNIYQLTENGERDGILGDDHWKPDIRVYYVSSSGDLFVRLA